MKKQKKISATRCLKKVNPHKKKYMRIEIQCHIQRENGKNPIQEAHNKLFSNSFILTIQRKGGKQKLYIYI